ncbi:MAG: glycogen/starch/alpha-glucan phosphorylase [Oscillospiraceae bacterium]|nr:glycogen/starch/alpha-glucan phosphorylase [Oscillospiraceae bacterium]
MEQFKETLRAALKDCKTPQDIHNAIGNSVLEYTAENWKKSKFAHQHSRRACYFSMEFLVGRAVYNNLLCLGLYDDAEAVLNEMGTSLSALEEIEDAALGNGGLGRLAACFLDSAASMDLPLDGYGIRYKYGLFKQGIENGFQTETADNWTQFGDPWSVRLDKEAVEVKFNGQTVKAVPYDMPIYGCKTNHVSTLRLWQAEAVNEFDFRLFNEQKYLEASAEKTAAEDISRVLYPNDDTREGKKLRLKQQYFFCSASLQDITKKHMERFGTLENLADSITVQLNDTHPVISIPELIRILTAQGMSFEKAFAITKNVFNYTNHTVMPEALEKWECSLIEELLPEIYSIILQIHEQLISEMYSKGLEKEKFEKIMIIRNGLVNMADMAVYCSSYVNGVAEIHTQILKDTVLADWYKLYPERFQNKTNGITQRRWLALCNKELAAMITDLTGGEEWMTDLDRLKALEQYADNDEIINRFLNIKKENKKALAEYIKKAEGIEINPNTVFDIQIKRLHEYKRQLLNAFSILYIYFGIKSGEIINMNPVTFIFGAKSAPGYRRAKGIIKYINEIAKLVENDEEVSRYIKVVFVSNYNVSYAEKLIPAADISEQISTAGTEASGTGNMKLMLNGAVTLGTYDGANIEIVEEAGEENNYIFGAKVEELKEIMPEYNSRKLLSENEKIRRVVSTLIDGTVSDGGTGVFRELYYSLTDGASWHSPDNYYLLGDLESYIEVKLKCIGDFGSKKVIGKKMWLNMCNAGKFSSDRTIRDYAENIWHIGTVEV